MIFNLIILILLGVIVYFHYLQGLLSAGLSAILAIIAALVALGYHETLVTLLLGGKMADYANALTLVALFAGVYIILRLLFDRLVPGNVRFPVLLDRVGAPVAGVVAGIFALGILAIAAAALPFGPDIGGYERYPFKPSRSVTLKLPNQNQLQTRNYIPVNGEAFIGRRSSGLWIPVDDMVLACARRASAANGALANRKPLASIHPDYLQQLFGQRLTLEAGAKHAALNTADSIALKAGPFAFKKIDQADAETSVASIRNKKEDQIEPKPLADGQIYVWLRVAIKGENTDKDNIFRVTPAAIRLTADGNNYFPVGQLGTVEGSETPHLLLNAIDDLILVEMDKAADLVFVVDEASLQVAENKPPQFRPGTFIEIKRLARVDLSGRKLDVLARSDIAAKWGAGREVVAVLRKQGPKPAEAPTPPKPGPDPVRQPDASGLPFKVGDVAAASKLPIKVAVPSLEEDAAMQLPNESECTLRRRKFVTLSITPGDPISKIQQGNQTVQELYVPNGKRMHIVQLEAKDGNWAALENVTRLALAGGGGTFKPYGVWATISATHANKFFALYSSDAELANVRRPAGAGTPTTIDVAFLLPDNITPASLTYEGREIKKLP